MNRSTRPQPVQGTTLMERLGGWSYRRRKLVVVTWAIMLVGLIALGSTAGGAFNTQFRLPGSESQAAIDLLSAHGFGDRAGAQGQIVFEAEQGIDDPAVRMAMEQFFAAVDATVPDTTVVSPYSPEGAQQVAEGRQIAYAELNFAERSEEAYLLVDEDVKALREEIAVPGLRIELGGDVFAEWAEPSSEVIGLLGAMVILLVAFGSLLAMGLPILAALFGIGTGIALIQLATNFVDMPDFTTPVAIMIGLGVGIDYALFIVTRYREGLAGGLRPRDAVVVATNTAGRAVLFAGTTVVLSFLGMFFMGMDMMRGFAIGTSLTVLMTMLASVTLVPAVLGFAGRHIDRFGLPHRKRSEVRPHASFWYRWSRLLQRYPWPAAIAGFAILVVLALPVLSLRLGFSDAGNRPTADTSRQAYDMLSEGFGPGFNGTLLIAVETPRGDADHEALGQLSEALNATDGVAYASNPIASPDGGLAIIQLVPTTSPQDEATSDLVHHLRDEVIPGAIGSSGLDPKLGGVTAASNDFSDYVGGRLPLFFAAVLTLSFVLLMAVFRSVLVPLKAIVMNLLSIGAAYGVLVAIFQWGWGLEWFGVGKEGPIEAWIPMMLFAIVFGLSMDYEVFLLSRIREEYDRTRDNALAVANGVASTARVISAAAAIMIFVFGGFVLGDDRALKIAGLGLAVAIAVDATIVRLILVPATMELLGDRNWWLPRWLDRLLPALRVEAEPGHGTPPEPVPVLAGDR
jgi:putative drug exporter of the RND superfamily